MSSSEAVLTEDVRRVLLEVFDDPSLGIESNTSRDELADWDSIAHLKIVLALEERFGLEFDTDEVASIRTVGEFVSALQARGK